MTLLSETDFSKTGLVISEAFIQAAEEYGEPGPPRDEVESIRWGDREIVAADIVKVPVRGRFKLELLYQSETTRQGADVDVSPGGVIVPGGGEPSLLRTWFDPGLPEEVEYEYQTSRGLLRTYNVYEMRFGDTVVEGRWDDNAGMWVEQIEPLMWVYHCSQGLSNPPNFSDLVYRLTVTPAQ